MPETITPRHRISVYLAGDYYVSRKAVLEKAAEISGRYDSGSFIAGKDFQFAHDLITKNPIGHEIIGCGVKGIEVYTPPTTGMGGKRPLKLYRVHRLDGTTCECHFKEALKGRIVDRQDFYGAAAIAVESQILKFGQRAFSSPTARIWCPEFRKWVSQEDQLVIYDGCSLKSLANKYLAWTGLDLLEVRYQRCPFRGGVQVFADVDDRREWQQYHARHAKLRIVDKIMAERLQHA